jgi:MFS family permease
MLTLSIVARLPLAMFSIGLLVHAQRLTNSFAAAGLVTAAYAVALGVGGPLLGRVVDRRGQTGVLLSAAGVCAALLCVIALLPAGAPLVVLVALAAGIGFATPPVGACLRTLLRDPAAFAVEASAVELTWVFGPPLAFGAGALFSTGAALAGAGLVLLVSTAAFAAHPVSRAWRPGESVAGSRGGSLRTPAMRTLALVLLAVGVLFGAVEIGVAAASSALGATAAAGPLLGVWGVGSLAGGAFAARAAHRGRGGLPLTSLLIALTAAHLALATAAGSVYALAFALFVAGAAIAPTYATVFALVERAAPAGTVTEAFAWLATAVAVGAAVGAAGAGAIAEHAGPAAVFVFAGGAGACALLATLMRSATVAACQTS